MSKLKIFILSDYAAFRQGLTRLLTMEEGMEVVQDLRCSLAAIDQVKHQAPDVVVYDYHSCPHKTVDTLAVLTAIAGISKIIVLAASTVGPLFSRADIAACYLMEGNLEDLKQLVWKVAAGYRPFATNSGSGHVMNEAAPYADLTKRELQIVKYLIIGKTSKEIGDILHIAHKTVEVHRHNILKKMGTSNTRSLVNLLTLHSAQSLTALPDSPEVVL